MSTTVPPAEFSFSERTKFSRDQPISYLMHKALSRPELISLAAGFVDQDSLPVDATRHAFEKVFSDSKQAKMALQYGTTAGYLPLREAVLNRWLIADKQTPEETGLNADRVVMTAGSNQLLHLITEALCDPGDIVLCTAPTYFVYLGILKSMGIRAVSVDLDEEGMIPESLQERLEALDTAGLLPKVKAIYVVSYYDNPANVNLAKSRRPAIVELAKRYSQHHRIAVFEDAAYRDLRYSGEDLPSLRSFDESGDTVAIAQTFSKSFSPGIRVGYGILPEDLVGPACNLKGNLDFGSPNLAQQLMTVVLEDGLFEGQVATLRQTYQVKLQAMLEAAEEYFSDLPGVHWYTPTGGLYVWLTLPENVDTGPDGKLFDLAMDEGMLYVPGQYAYPSEPHPPAKNTIRLSYGVQSPERIREGMKLLAHAVQKILTDQAS